MRTIKDITDLQNKKVLLRADFDVPIREDGKIQEAFRILRQKAMLDHLVQHGARVIMMAHINAVDSFRDLVPQFQEILGHPIGFIERIEDIPTHLEDSQTVALLDNIRQFEGEKTNDEGFALNLSKGFDLYVNNAFAVCHRNHASVSAITKFLPAYGGLLIEEEINQLGTVIDAPILGKIIIMGGAKASTKLPVIKNFIDKADTILIGGVIANDILKAKGVDVGSSVVDEDVDDLIAGLDLRNEKLMLPHDYNIANDKILDIGPESIRKYEDRIRAAKGIIWNGPMGLFEDDAYSIGTDAVARAILASGAVSVIGGGDTIAAISRIGLLEKFNFVSTGGGAMLAFLAGQELPGLKALQ